MRVSQNPFESRHPREANQDIIRGKLRLAGRYIETSTRDDQITYQSWRRSVCIFYSVVVCLLGATVIATTDRHPRSTDVAIGDLTSSIAAANGHTFASNAKRP